MDEVKEVITYRFAIVDDSRYDQEILRKHLQSFMNEKGYRMECEIFDDPVKFLNNYKKVYDIVFMDVEMPLINGISASQQLRQVDPDVTLIFVTNFAQYAINGYEVAAADYIVKPIQKDAFQHKMERALKYVEENKKKNYILLKTEKGLRKFRIDEISYIEVLAHYLYFHIGKDTFKIRGTLKEIMTDKKFSDHFFQINKAYYVNLSHVLAVDGLNIQVDNDVLLMSRLKKNSFLENLALHYGKVNG